MGCCGSDINAADLAGAQWEGAIANVETAPVRADIENAAATGGKVTVDGVEYDFKGLSDADTQAKYMDAMAKSALDIQNKYGAGYIEQRLKELETSDPEGTQLRKDLFSTITSDLDASKAPELTQANKLQREIMADLERGGELGPDIEREVAQAVRGQQAARGSTLGTASAVQEAGALNTATESMAEQRRQRALSFLTSGVSPEDVTYRRTQQGLSNLGSFVAGTTPTAQFKQLSGAQNQAAPVATGAAGSIIDPNAGNAASAYNLSTANAQNQWNANQVNPWLAGLQTGVGTYNAFSAWGNR